MILPTKPYTPRHKGKVERGIDYVQENGLRGHRFKSLEEENVHLLEWEKTVADTRIHGTTRRQVGKTFQEVERAALHPLPRERFPFLPAILASACSCSLGSEIEVLTLIPLKVARTYRKIYYQ